MYMYSWIKKVEAEIEKLTPQRLIQNDSEIKPLKICKRRKQAIKIQSFWEENMTNQSRIAKLLRVGKEFVRDCFSSLNLFGDLREVVIKEEVDLTSEYKEIVRNYFRRKENLGKSLSDLQKYLEKSVR